MFNLSQPQQANQLDSELGTAQPQLVLPFCLAAFFVRLFPVGKRDPKDYDQQDGNESPDNDHEVMPAIEVLNFALSFTVRDT